MTLPLISSSLVDFAQQGSTPSSSKSSPVANNLRWLSRTHGVSNVVARGSQLHLPLRSQNREFGAPCCENYATISHFQWTMMHLLLSLAEVSPHNEWGILPWTKDTHPSPKTPLTCLLVVSRLELYRTYVLLYSTYVLLARLTKVRR